MMIRRFRAPNLVKNTTAGNESPLEMHMYNVQLK